MHFMALFFWWGLTRRAVIISITLGDSIATGQRLTKKIREYNKKIPIFVGGQAFTFGSKAKFDGEVITDISLSQISKVIRPKKNS